MTTKTPSTQRLPITPRSLLEVKRLSDPQIHPDGQRVAFVVTEADFDESLTISHLWLTEFYAPESTREEGQTELPLSGILAEPQPSEPGEEEEPEEEHDPTRQLTFSYEGETAPHWSPDGRYLAFVSARPDPTQPIADDDNDNRDQVWILPVDGGEARRLTQAKEGVLDYLWTPDSQAILYLASEPHPAPIDTVRKEDRDQRKNDPIVEHEERLRRQFWRIEIEEKKPILLYTGDYGLLEFAVSPNGEHLCFTTNRTGDPNDYHVADLFLLSLETGETKLLSDRRGGKYHLRWSPEGTQVAFLSWFDPEISYSRESLFVVDALSDSPRTELRSDLDFDIAEFEWSRHDQHLYVIASVGTGSEVYRIGESTERMEFPDGAERNHLAIAPEGGTELAFVQETAQAMPEIFLRDEAGALHQLTKLNADFAERYHLPEQKVVRWNSPDGTKIEGVLTYPNTEETEIPCPLIVDIHGGPKGRATDTLRSYLMHPVWAAEGYAVLRPNFRGSEGYGNAFAVANRRDLGGGDFADILSGVDWCIAQGIAAPDRLGISGGSYGGYMTNWAIGQTDRFKAAVSLFGIFHLQTDYSNSELSRWANDYLGAYYWEEPEIYRRLSPGSYLENIKTPTLILHGDEDSNTFISNSKELYQALRHRGVPTQFVHYPREGHGLREPNHRLDEIRRCLAWMDKYVRSGGQEPTEYRIGDKLPSSDGLLELCITRAEVVTYLGQPKPEEKESREGEEESNEKSALPVLLEVTFTVHNRDTRQAVEPLTLRLDQVRIEMLDGASETLLPVGVPLDLPGGKSLVEGENMRLTMQPDPETHVLAFGCAVVFRGPRTGGQGRLRVAGFPPVRVFWTGEDA